MQAPIPITYKEWRMDALTAHHHHQFYRITVDTGVSATEKKSQVTSSMSDLPVYYVDTQMSELFSLLLKSQWYYLHKIGDCLALLG